jgi:hypothetical protein
MLRLAQPTGRLRFEAGSAPPSSERDESEDEDADVPVHPGLLVGTALSLLAGQLALCAVGDPEAGGAEPLDRVGERTAERTP